MNANKQLLKQLINESTYLKPRAYNKPIGCHIKLNHQKGWGTDPRKFTRKDIDSLLECMIYRIWVQYFLLYKKKSTNKKLIKHTYPMHLLSNAISRAPRKTKAQEALRVKLNSLTLPRIQGINRRTGLWSPSLERAFLSESNRKHLTQGLRDVNTLFASIGRKFPSMIQLNNSPSTTQSPRTPNIMYGYFTSE